MKCVKCLKDIKSGEFKCLKCGAVYCSRNCQVNNVQRHRYYCKIRPSDFVGQLIQEVEPFLRSYCYLMRKKHKSLGDITIEHSRNLSDPYKKIFPIKFGQLPPELPKSDRDSYIIYINTGDYRGYFKYPTESPNNLDEIDTTKLDISLYLNTNLRKICFT